MNLNTVQYDTSIFIVTPDNELVYCLEYVSDPGSEMNFIMLTNESLNPDYGPDNTMYIYPWMCDFDLQPECVWQVERKHIPGLRQYDFNEMTPREVQSALSCDLNGHQNTLDIMTGSERMARDYYHENGGQMQERQMLRQYIPAIMKAHDMTAEFNGRTYHGYVPSAGQARILMYNIFAANLLLKNRGFGEMKKKDEFLWTSSEYSAECFCSIDVYESIFFGLFKDVMYGSKAMRLIPLFALEGVGVR